MSKLESVIFFMLIIYCAISIVSTQIALHKSEVKHTKQYQIIENKIDNLILLRCNQRGNK